MALERTFSILKPDATRRNLTGAVNAVIEKAGLRIVAQKRIRMTRGEAEMFYGVHRERPFFRRTGRVHDLGSGGRAGARG
jgi:nucleoside-diphosphate kinase